MIRNLIDNELNEEYLHENNQDGHLGNSNFIDNHIVVLHMLSTFKPNIC